MYGQLKIEYVYVSRYIVPKGTEIKNKVML